MLHFFSAYILYNLFYLFRTIEYILMILFINIIEAVIINKKTKK
jgi:hypothetical protein